MFRKHHITPIALTAFLSVGLIPTGIASPTIDNVKHLGDKTISVEGSNFGLGPSVLLFDTLQNADVSSDSVQLRPERGEWYETKGNNTEFVEGPFGPDSKGLIVRQTSTDNGLNLTFGENDSEGIHDLKHFQEVYYSFALQDLGDFPDGDANTFAETSAAKDSWMMFGDRGDATNYSRDVLGVAAGHDLAIPTWIGWTFTIAGNNTPMDPVFRLFELRDNWDFGGWVTYMFHAKLDQNDPYGDAEGFFAFLNKNAYHKTHRQGNLMTDQSDEGVPYPYWDRIKFNGWARTGDAEIRRAMSNFYVAVGKNANARIILTDAETLENSSKIQHLIPKDWNNTSITAELPDFQITDQVFVHVITSDNETSNGVLSINPPARTDNLQVE